MNINKYEHINDVKIYILNIRTATGRVGYEFEKELSSEINSGSLKIVVDMSSCESLEYAFLTSMLRIFRLINSLNGKIILSGIRPSIRLIFELTKIFRVFEIYRTKEEAIKSFTNHKVKAVNN